MKDDVEQEELRSILQEPSADYPARLDEGSRMPVSNSQVTGLSRFSGNLPAWPRFSDKAQRRAAGNIVRFIAALLVLTLIARGASGATLARVEVTNPSRGEIVDAVTGSATVAARDSLDINPPEGLTIREMLIGQGQTVEAGDAVAVFDPAEVFEKLTREEASLNKLLIDLEKLERDETTDSTSRESARRNLQRAREDYDIVKSQCETDVAAAEKNLADAMGKSAEDADASALETARRSLERAREDLLTGKTRDAADVAAAQTTLDNAIKNKSDTADYTAVENALRNLTRERQDYNTVKAQGDKAVSDARDALDAATDEDSEDIARAALEETQKTAAASLQTAARRVEDAEASYNNALSNYNNSSLQASNSSQAAIDSARNALDAANKKAADNLLSAERRVEDAQIALTQAEANYGKSEQQLSQSRQTEIENVRNALETARKKADDSLLSAARRVEDAEISLSAAERDYRRNAQQSADTAIQNSASAVSLKLDIEDQKAIVDALQMLFVNDGVVFSDITGVVLAAKPEGSVTGRDALVAFMDGARGFDARMTLDKTDADKLSVGDECQVTTGGGSIYFTPTVTGIVASITPPDEQDRAQVVIRLPDGDWSDGQKVDVQAVKDRSTYDMCVPLSALRSDNSGYFLLVVEQRSTVLGIENVVVRVPVSVTASDSESAAVQGPVSRSSQVVTASSKAVSAGDRIRIKT